MVIHGRRLRQIPRPWALREHRRWAVTGCFTPANSLQIPVSGQGSSVFWDRGLRDALPWLLSILGVMVLASVTARYLWWRFMEPSSDVEVLFKKLAALGRLNSAGPRSHETPFQYGRRLEEVLPDQQAPFAVLIGSYVRRKYGGKELDQEEISQLSEAWLTLRMALLLRIFRPRNPQRAI